jgi:hypothetical protein
MLLIGCPGSMPKESAADTAGCTIATWEEFNDRKAPAICARLEACEAESFYYWWDTLADCEASKLDQYADLPERVADEGCGPFVEEALCSTLACEAEFLADCDADCDLGDPSHDWFEPGCSTDY